MIVEKKKWSSHRSARELSFESKKTIFAIEFTTDNDYSYDRSQSFDFRSNKLSFCPCLYIYILHTQKSGKKIVAIQTIVVCIALTTSQEEDEKRKEIEKKWNRYNMCPCTFSCTRYDLWFNILLVRKRENGINFLLLFSYRSIISSSYESLPLLLCRRRRRRRRRRCCHHRSRRHYECKVYGNE